MTWWMVALMLPACGLQDEVRQQTQAVKQRAAQTVERKAVEFASRHAGINLPISDLQLTDNGASVNVNGLRVHVNAADQVPASWPASVQSLPNTNVESTISAEGAQIVLASGKASPKDTIDAHRQRCGAPCATPVTGAHQADGSSAVYLNGQTLIIAYAMPKTDDPGTSHIALAQIDLDTAAKLASTFGVSTQGGLPDFSGLGGLEPMKQIEALQELSVER